MKQPVSPGQCALCKGSFPKASMTRHLRACPAKAAPLAASAKKGPSLATFHLLVEGRDLPEYWLHLELPARATLESLDRFLRSIWLECCGHMSAFTIAGASYSSSPLAEPFGAEEGELSMKSRLCEVLAVGTTFEYEYDFGSSTNLRLKVLGERTRPGRSADVEVLARNDPIPIVCESCGQPATQVCSACLWDAPAWFCDKCSKKHKCDAEMFLPVVNSPRVGTCGYCG